MLLSTLASALGLSGLALGAPLEVGVQPHINQAAPKTDATKTTGALPAPFCFPALGFQMPLVLPEDNTDWWCDPTTEYAFVGFSYEVTACKWMPGSE